MYTCSEVLERYHEGPDTGIFTDGSSRPNPGPGGWGVVAVREGEIVTELYGQDGDTTNNRMELTAIIEALKITAPEEAQTIYTDSELCSNTLNTWARQWEKNGWRRKSGPIKNLDLVREAFSLFQARPQVSLQWTRGHSGWRWNEYADALSTSWARENH